jgi:RNA polymerase sigma-70 factor (sigma-E family)
VARPLADPSEADLAAAFLSLGDVADTFLALTPAGCPHGWRAAGRVDAAPILSSDWDNLPMSGVVILEVRLQGERRGMAGGAEAEFEEFAARDGGRLLGLALLLTGDRQDAEDLVQSALLRSASHWSAARRRPEGYARVVLVNLARERWRKRRRRAETFAPDLAFLASSASADVAAAVLDRQLLLRACRLLPVQQRAVLVLRFWEDRSVDETAALLGCSAGTVKSNTHRALARLRLVLQEAPEFQAGPTGGRRHAERP